MALFEFPNPIGMYESAVNGKLERKAADALISSSLSGWLTFLWTFGKRSLLGFGPALQDMATSQYLTLSRLESKNFLTLTIPKEMLEPDNLSRFQSEWHTK